MSEPWTPETWQRLEARTRRAVLAASAPARATAALAAQGWRVMRHFSTGFFLASRFLPAETRRRVELIYAAVRYPDEIVDTFDWPAEEKNARLDEWCSSFERMLDSDPLEAVRAGVPTILAGFVQVARDKDIPARHYRDFLAAMRLDCAPPPYETLEELIDRYVHGSAVVVGYFLAHVYGSGPGVEPARTLAAARELGIALQLTNFCRDVAEDHRRGRLYLPLCWLREEGIEMVDAADPDQAPALLRVVHRLASAAEGHYARALAELESFAPETRPAIAACIGVYRRLNDLVLARRTGPLVRLSVPWREKLAVLPPSKLWRLPAAYLRLI